MTLNLFFRQTLRNLEKRFFNEEKVSQDNMMRYFWTESCENARINKFVHKSAVRYSPLFIRMCVMVRNKVKNGMYDFLAKTFHWPSSRTVSEYDFVGGQNLDGAMYDVLEQA